MRFERTALYAHEHGFKVITSSLGMSRWKDLTQSIVAVCGQLHAIKIWFTGRIIGANMEDQRVCTKSPKAKIFINRNIADVFIP